MVLACWIALHRIFDFFFLHVWVKQILPKLPGNNNMAQFFVSINNALKKWSNLTSCTWSAKIWFFYMLIKSWAPQYIQAGTLVNIFVTSYSILDEKIFHYGINAFWDKPKKLNTLFNLHEKKYEANLTDMLLSASYSSLHQMHV